MSIIFTENRFTKEIHLKMHEEQRICCTLVNNFTCLSGTTALAGLALLLGNLFAALLLEVGIDTFFFNLD